MDAITLLRNDHRAVEKLFKAFENARRNEKTAAKEEAVRGMVRELSAHAAIEEQLFYPTVRAAVKQTHDIVLESLEEHHVVKWMLSEIDGMSAADERYDAKVTVLIENVRHHVDEEQDDLFPKVRKVMSRKALDELGSQLAALKKVAPTHPHPRVPDTPPGNVVAGLVGATADLTRDAVAGAGRAAIGAVRRAADQVTEGASGRANKSAGSAKSGAKSTGRKARSAATSTSRAAKATARTATSGARSTARAAKSAAKATGRSAKATGTTAKSGTKSTARAAKSAAKSTARSAAKAPARSAAKSPARSAAKSPARSAAKSTARSAAKSTRSTTTRVPARRPTAAGATGKSRGAGASGRAGSSSGSRSKA